MSELPAAVRTVYRVVDLEEDEQIEASGRFPIQHQFGAVVFYFDTLAQARAYAQPGQSIWAAALRGVPQPDLWSDYPDYDGSEDYAVSDGYSANASTVAPLQQLLDGHAS